MLLNISGLTSQLGLQLIDATRPQQMEQLQREPRSQRGVEAFVDGIGTITSPEEFVDNFEVYSFVMQAFDLEDQIFGRGLMRKMLESDPSDDAALVNRLTDSRFREIHDALGFTKSETLRPDFNDSVWQQRIIDRYFEQEFENGAAEQNETVGAILKFRREAAEINNWFEVMRDAELTEFFQTALGLPREMTGLSPDQQKTIFEGKLDISTITDPEVQERLSSRYVALSDAQNVSVFSPALSMLSSSGGVGVIISLNIPQVQFSASALYR